VHNIQPVGIFQCKIFSQQGYSNTNYSASRDNTLQNIQPVGNIPVQNIQPGGNIPVHNIQPGGNIPVQNIQPVGICQYKIFSQ
jgi:hypothetical protein